MKKHILLSVMALNFLLLSIMPAHAVQSVNSDTTLNPDGFFDGVNFAGDYTLTVTSPDYIGDGAPTNAATTATHNTGSLMFNGTSSILGIVGSSANARLKGLSGGSANSTLDLSANTFVSTMTVRSTGTVVMGLSADLNADTLNFDANGHVRFSAAADLTATVTTDTNHTGSLSFNDSVFPSLSNPLIVGQIGTNTARLGSLSAGATGGKAVFSNDVYVANTYVAQRGTMVFNGSLTGNNLYFNQDGQVIMGNNANINAVVSTLTNNTGSVTFSGASSITQAFGSVAGNDLKLATVEGGVVTVSSGADYAVTNTIVRTNTAAGTSGTLKAGANQTFTGNLLMNGAGSFDSGNTLSIVTGDFELATNTTLKTTLTSVSANSSTTGVVRASAAADDARVRSGSTLNVNATPGAFVPTGTVFTLVDGHTSGTDVAAPGTVLDNSAALSFTPSVANNDLVMTVTRSYNAVTGENATPIASSLNGFSSSASGDMALVISNLDTLSTAQGLTDAMNQLDPSMNGGVNQASFNAATGALNTVTTRLDNARNGLAAGNGQNGISTGDEFRDVGIWTQGFGIYGDQDDKDGISGYTASTWGAAGGLDFRLDERTRLGVSFAYSQSNIDQNDSLSNTDVQGFQGSVYGTYEGDPWYLDLMFSTSWNNYEGSRRIQFASIDRTAEQDYDGMQYSGKATFGYPIEISQGWSLVPVISLLYSHLNLDSFTESGAGALNLNVAEQEYDFLQQGLGAKIITEWTDRSKQRWVPSFHALWLYDYIGDEASSTSSFTAGGNSFTTQGLEPDQSSLNVGAGITVYPTEALSLNLSYDFQASSDYTGHYGSATLRYEY